MVKNKLLILLLLLFCFKSRANCPTLETFYEDFQKIKQLEPGSTTQLQSLEQWQTKWKQCYPIADSIYVNSLTYKGMNYYRQGKLTEAIQWHEEAVRAFDSNHGLRLKLSSLVKIYYRLGVFYTTAQRLDESTTILHKLINVAGSQPSLRTWVNQAHLYLIYNYYVLGDFERALQHANAGEILSEELKDPIALSKVLQQKAQVLQSLKRNNEALTTIEKAIPLIQDSPIHSTSLSSQYMLKGNILRDLQQFTPALASIQKGYHIAKSSGEKYLSDFSIAIGYLHQTTKQYPLAIQSYKQALLTDAGSHNRCLIYNNLANIYKRQGKFDQAIEQLQLGLKTLLPELDITGPALPLQASAIKHLQQKEFLLGLTRDYAEVWLEYAKSHNNQPTYLDQALKTFMVADSMIDFMRWQHTGTSSKLYWRQQTSDMYEQAIEASFLSQQPDRAFYFFEKSRAILLNDELNTLNATQRLSEKDVQKDKDIRQEINRLQEALHKEKKDSPTYVALVDQLVKVENQQKALIEEWKTTNPTYYQYKYNSQVPTTEDIQRRLLAPMGDNSSFLTYHIGKNYVFGICISSTSIQYATVSKVAYDSLMRSINRYLPNKALQNQSYKHFLQQSHALYQLLLAPFSIAKNSRVIISTNNAFFPFEMLSSSPTEPQYWGLQHATSYAYSGSFLLKKQQGITQSTTSKNFLGMAPVEFAPYLQQATLTGSEKTTELIESFFSSSSSLLFSNATRQAFLEQLPQYKMVQLLTHAIADSTQSEPTLYFADSTLLLSDIHIVSPINTQLIVLSACQTGIGELQMGEGIYSLARGFAATGIPSVVSTLWSVENQPIYELTTLFFQSLKNGTPLDIALLEARQEWMRTSNGVDQLPYTWAGLVLIGNTEAIELTNLHWLKITGLGSLLVLIASSLFYYRKTRVQKRY